jgi:diguanylate cyclase (GGDEF)-like protein
MLDDTALNEEAKRKYGIPIFLALVVAGLAGNYFNFPIFLNIAFLFGSIFAMLALQIFGLGRGVLAAALISSYTYILWNHPYAIVTMTVEMAIVGLLTKRKKIGLVIADTIYWLVIGMPLVFIFYHLVMHSQLDNTYINMTKQTINGITNALFARLIFSGVALYYRSTKISFHEIIYNLLAFFVLCPALVMLAVSSRTDFKEADLKARTSLLQDSRVLSKILDEWVSGKKAIVRHLAEMAASRSPQQMTSYLQLATESQVAFLRIGLFDKEAISTTYFPLMDELGQTNIGKDFSDRAYLPALKRTREPMVSEALSTRIGIPKPMVLALAPVRNHGEYAGYIAGTLSLEQLQAYMDLSTDNKSMRYTVLDKAGNIIMTNRADQTVMKPFARGNGSLNHLAPGIDQWLPVVLPNTPISDQWFKSSYIAETTLGDMVEWKLILEQPVAPIQNLLYINYSGKLTLLFLILIVALVLGEFLSRRIMTTLKSLGTLTSELPARLAANDKAIIWPESGVDDTSLLIDNFKGMTDSLSSQFRNIRHLNESLEQRVEERTLALSDSEKRLLDILNVSPIAVRIATNNGSKVAFYNQGYANLIKNIDATGDDPKKYYVRIKEYEEVLAELVQGNTIINRQIELRIPDGSSVWTLASYMPTKYQGEDAVLGWFYDITGLKEAEEKIRLLALHDSLTRLPNRQLMLDRLQHALVSGIRNVRQGALLFIDMDNFKTINDTLGHLMGDMLLQQVAQRLTSCVRECDTVARLGGDEFVVLLEYLSDQTIEAATQAEAISEKILAALSQPYQLNSHTYRISASIGATVFSGNLENSEELLKQADIAMYQAKKAGRNTLRFFDPQMQEAINVKAALEEELHKALEQEHFHLHYQIQVDSANHPIGAEVLIRWNHALHGMVSPAQFIPLAEETGLILPIGQWVLDTACAQISAWQQHPLTEELSMAVNVSARQFRQADFVAQVEASMQRHGIIPRRLKLELTESMLLEDIEEIIVTMNALKAIGVQFSLDDFGTGYSSLQYLKRLPLDQLKIDQSFVRDIVVDSSDRAIVRTIIAMAESMNISVIAEGVETEEQRQLLLEIGCSNFQGYLFSKPVPIEQFETLLKNA